MLCVGRCPCVLVKQGQLVCIGHVLSLEEKLEFPFYLPLSLVSHWIGDGRLGIVYANSSHAYCYKCWVTFPHACTHVEPGPGSGGARATTCGHECQFDFRGLLDLLHFFYFLFLFKNSVEIFRVELDTFKRIESARYNHSRMITDSPGLLQTERSADGYKYLSLHVSFT